MTKIKIIVLSIVFVAVLPFSALAGSYVKLGESKKASSFQTIGKVKKKKKSQLKLGSLRTDEAKLPSGKLSLSGRMKLRAKRALQRQNAISRAKRSSAPSQMDDLDLEPNYNRSDAQNSESGLSPEANSAIE